MTLGNVEGKALRYGHTRIDPVAEAFGFHHPEGMKENGLPRATSRPRNDAGERGGQSPPLQKDPPSTVAEAFGFHRPEGMKENGLPRATSRPRNDDIPPSHRPMTSDQ